MVQESNQYAKMYKHDVSNASLVYPLRILFGESIFNSAYHILLAGIQELWDSCYKSEEETR